MYTLNNLKLIMDNNSQLFIIHDYFIKLLNVYNKVIIQVKVDTINK